MIKLVAVSALLILTGCALNPSRDRTWLSQPTATGMRYRLHEKSTWGVWKACGAPIYIGCVKKSPWVQLASVDDPDPTPKPIYEGFTLNSELRKRHECGHLNRLAAGASLWSEAIRDWGEVALKFAANNPFFPWFGIAWGGAEMGIPATDGGEC